MTNETIEQERALLVDKIFDAKRNRAEYMSRRERKELNRSYKHVRRSLKRIFKTDVTVEQRSLEEYYLPALDMTICYDYYPNVYEDYGLVHIEETNKGDEFTRLQSPADFVPFMTPTID